jgi:fumarate hydratase class II
MTTRTEKDSLGIVQVPADALYGAQTQRAVLNFPISGLKPYRAFIWAMALIKRAAAEVNHELGLFSDRDLDGKKFTAQHIVDAIVQAAQEVMDGKLDAHFVVDPFQAGAGTSHNMNVNEVIANRANQLLGYRLDEAQKPVSPNDHVNMAQSTNDTIPTAIRLGALWRLDELLNAIDGLADALEMKAREFAAIVKSGRTHLQDAVPVTLGQEFSAYALAIRHDQERITTAGNRLRRMPIGGTATGTGLNAHPAYHARMVRRMSELSNISLRESENLFEAMQSQADAADFSAAMNTLAVTLTRIANDFRLLASGPMTGLDEIRLPAVQPGSSIMPGKINPVLAEMLNMLCYHIMGNNLTVSLATAAGQLELNVMMPIIAYNVFQTMDLLINGLQAFTEKCVVGITANPDKAAGWLARNPIVATALNPLVGYLVGAELVKEAMKRNLTIREVAAERIANGELKHKDTGATLTMADIDAVLGDLRKLTEGGLGGPAGGG